MVNTINTSIKQVPALAKHKPLLEDLKKADLALNFGCGRYPELVDQYTGHNWVKYDPNTDWDEYRKNVFDVVMAANVLNVIQSDLTLNNVVKQIAESLFCDYSVAYISVYEGNRTAVGTPTSKGYQRNLKATGYTELLKKYFHDVEKKGNIFKCKRPKT